MAKNKEELKAVLMAQEVYMPDGETPNTTKLNIISGAVIPPLMEAICQERDSIGSIDAVEAYLWELYEKSEYHGFTLLLAYDTFGKAFRLTLKGELSHTIDLGSDIHGNIQRMDNALEALPTRLSACEKALADLRQQMENAKTEIAKPFAQEEELKANAARLAELDSLLNMDKKQNEALDAEPDNDAIEIERKRDCAR